jgi:hypothetical protein
VVHRTINSLSNLLSNRDLPAINNTSGARLDLHNGFLDDRNGKVMDEIIMGWALADLVIYILLGGGAADYPGSAQ